jgi:hypothetical protein
LLQFTFSKDRNEDYPDEDIEMIDATGYGRLDFILALTLPASDHFEIEEPVTHVLAHITEAKDVEGDAATELITFNEFGRSFILNITNVENVAGRIRTHGIRRAGEWAIVDRSGAVVRTQFHVEEEPGADGDE